jgi:hypothetical protein
MCRRVGATQHMYGEADRVDNIVLCTFMQDLQWSMLLQFYITLDGNLEVEKIIIQCYQYFFKIGEPRPLHQMMYTAGSVL